MPPMSCHKKRSVIQSIRAKWGLRRFWFGWFIRDITIAYYNIRYGMKLGGNFTCIPTLGKGKYVSVYRSGDIVDVVSETKDEMFRWIPYQENHGFMVEHWIDGKMNSRLHFGIEDMKEYCTFGIERK